MLESKSTPGFSIAKKEKKLGIKASSTCVLTFDDVHLPPHALLGTEGAGDADVGLKRAIQDGIVPGPRLFVATRAIVATGAYGPARRDYALGWDQVPQGAQEASGEAEMMKAARQQMAQGAGPRTTARDDAAARLRAFEDISAGDRGLPLPSAFWASEGTTLESRLCFIVPPAP